ncbi:ABC transporter ATP-binding protein NatA [Rubritalea halochordaticola]|uniref:ABC transporter ATP-binding protein NatA n=1 Tax=Rubritalea halochordaticola TaxID=714537 RepID=A0ABP9UZG4_9BACT
MIVVEDVHKTYRGGGNGEVAAVQGVSFRCEPGRVFALLGPNGSGKTTLLRIISTLMKADFGTVEVAGQNVREQGAEVRKHLGFLTGTAGLHEKLSPLESLEFFGRLQGIKGKLLTERISALTEQFELGEFLKRPSGRLSMGQKQRVMIARTLIHDPGVVVFDEATTGLDVLAAKALTDLIRHCREEGKTVLFSTHIMGEVSMLADDVTIFHHGKQVYLGTFEDLKSQQVESTLEDEFVRLLTSEEVADA